MSLSLMNASMVSSCFYWPMIFLLLGNDLPQSSLQLKVTLGTQQITSILKTKVSNRYVGTLMMKRVEVNDRIEKKTRMCSIISPIYVR